MKGKVPPRGPVFDHRPMLLVFDVDCGELIPGHRFIARGLGGPLRVDIPADWHGDAAQDEQLREFQEAGGYPACTLEYELVPGVRAAEAGGDFYRYVVGIFYSADVDLPWDPSESGEIGPFEGGDATHGSEGDWLLPPAATTLTFALVSPDSDGVADSANSAGELVIDLVRGDAAWRPR